jgi:predicted dehydrogenase
MKNLHVGLIGSGFIGRAHAIALAGVGAVFPDIPAPVCELLADQDPTKAQAAAAALGFRRSTGAWRELVADPAIDIVCLRPEPRARPCSASSASSRGRHRCLPSPGFATCGVRESGRRCCRRAR